MAASFPGSTKTWTPVADNTDEIMASHVNDLYEEVIAVENALRITRSYVATWKSGAIAKNGKYTDDLTIPAGTYLVVVDLSNEDTGTAWFGEGGSFNSSGTHYLKINTQENASRVMTFTAEATVNLFNQNSSSITPNSTTHFFELIRLY